MKHKTISRVSQLSNLKNKVVILRTNYDLPIENNNITDSSRILDSIKTISYLYKKKAKIVIITHLDRPNGRIIEKLRLDLVAKQTQKIFRKYINKKIRIKKYDYIVHDSIKQYFCNKDNINNYNEIVMLENIRFDKREESNHLSLAKEIINQTHAQYYINEAFAVCHRKHSSVTQLPFLLKSYAGFSLINEISRINNILTNYKKPFIAIIGGVKLRTKLKAIKNLLNKVDKVIIVGAMVFTFLKSQNIDVGKTIVDKEYLKHAKLLLKKYPNKIYIPIDFVVTDSIDNPNIIKNIEIINNIKPNFKNYIGVDIGKKSLDNIINLSKQAKTIIWNGPLGVFEKPQFSKASVKLATTLNSLKNKKIIIGGGDTLNIFKLYNLKKNNIWHISMGGGALLALIEAKNLPGIKALEK